MPLLISHNLPCARSSKERKKERKLKMLAFVCSLKAEGGSCPALPAAGRVCCVRTRPGLDSGIEEGRVKMRCASCQSPVLRRYREVSFNVNSLQYIKKFSQTAASNSYFLVIWTHRPVSNSLSTVCQTKIRRSAHILSLKC